MCLSTDEVYPQAEYIRLPQDKPPHARACLTLKLGSVPTAKARKRPSIHIAGSWACGLYDCCFSGRDLRLRATRSHDRLHSLPAFA